MLLVPTVQWIQHSVTELFTTCQSDKIKIIPHCNFNLLFSYYLYGWIFISLQVISFSSTVNCHFLFLPSEKLTLRLSRVFQFFFHSCRLFLIVVLLFTICVSLGKLLNLSESKWLICAAAKSLQSCPILCDPVDGSPPGSPIPGILQARTLEWVAISFSNAWKWKVKVKLLSRVRLLATSWTAAYQAPPSMGFSRQDYWSRVPLPSPKLLICKVGIVL